MSYILEALKRAEAERHADAPPPARVPPGFGTVRQAARRDRPWRQAAIAALALLALAAGAAWYALGGQARTASKEIVAKPATTPPPPLAASAVAPGPAAHHPPAQPAQPVEQRQEAPAKKAPAPKRPPVASAKAPAKPDVEATHREPSAKAALPRNDADLPTLRELPEQVQRDIPALSVGGYIYSGNRADRSVLINKRLLREGDDIAPGLRLEQMTRDGMVLNYKGYRYRASY